jgi:hypothetical protein
MLDNDLKMQERELRRQWEEFCRKKAERLEKAVNERLRISINRASSNSEA